jgi:cytochrome c553
MASAGSRFPFELAIAVTLMAMPIAATAIAIAEPLHGSKLAEAYCAGCHGADGNGSGASPQYPKLAGQKASYLRAQLRAFKRGARKSDLMAGPASAISDSQIVELARVYSRQAVKADTVKDPQLAAIGRRIFNRSMRHAPACAACHNGSGSGPMGRMMGGRGGMMRGNRMGMMMGNLANVPNLNGQHAAYTIQQLDAFASGARPGTVMGPIAGALSERDRKAVAEYLSGLR